MTGFITFFWALGKWIVDHLAPIATFTAALVALFKEDFVKRWRHPKLSLRLRLGPPDSSSVPTVFEWTAHPSPESRRWEGRVWYFRFWIENSGSWPAERVEVNLRSISNRLGDGRFTEVHTFIPLNLRWSHSPINSPVIFETLNPQMGKHCDLGAVSPASNGSQTRLPDMKDGESTFNLLTQVFPSDNSTRLKPGKYRLEVLVAAQNARPKRFNVDFDWSGIFEESAERMLTDSVRITISEAKKSIGRRN